MSRVSVNELRSTLGRDVLASVVVFLVALPLCMGIAIASGVPPALGLITGIVGGLVVGPIAGSPLQVSGPAAGLAVIVFELVQDHGIGMLGPIVLLAGAFQLAGGMLGFGQYFRAIAPPVIYGMLAGIGVLIFASQFHVMLDDKPIGNGLENLIGIPIAIYRGIFPLDGSMHEEAAVDGIVTIAMIVLWEKFRPKSLKSIPAPLVAVVVATTLATALDWPLQHVDVPANLLDATAPPTAETLFNLTDLDLIGAALAMAIIASAETLLCAVGVDRMHQGPRTNFDKELRAQGIGNMVCGVLGALPMTGVIVRSSANVQAGAKTRLSAILHGVWLLALVVALPFVLRLIPTASLAGLLVYTGYKLVNPANLKQLATYGRWPVIIYFATMAGIIATDLLKGVMLGVVLTIGKLVYDLTHYELRVEPVAGTRRVDLHLGGSVTFVGLPRLAAALDQIPSGSELHLHIATLHHIDHACLDALAAWEKHGEQRGSSLVVEWDELMARYTGPGRKPDGAVNGLTFAGRKTAAAKAS